MTAPSDQILSSVQAILAAQGLTPEDLAAYVARAAHVGSDSSSRYPTLQERVDKAERGLTKNTKRTWKTHLDRLIDGTPEVCDCLCDACLDLEAGCGCGCSACAGSKLKIEGRPDLVLSRNSVVPSDVEEWATVAERHAQKKAIGDNKVRVARGLSDLNSRSHFSISHACSYIPGIVIVSHPDLAAPPRDSVKVVGR